MQAGTKGDKSRSSLRIGERHTSGIGRRKAEIAKAILPIDFCSHRRFVATFVKKDGSIRTIVFSPKFEYNEMIGKETTDIGRQIVETKCRRNMINIVEFYRPDDMIDGPECFRPRTINLNTILDLRIAA